MENNGNALPIFDFTDNTSKVKEISMNDLNRSIRRESGLAGIRAIPTQYWKIYMVILAMLEEQELNYTEGEIYVQHNSSKAYLTDEDKAEGYTAKLAPINRWRFDKIITSIQLPGVTEGSEEGVGDARNSAIGLSLNKEGLSLAFGMNVWACTNFNVMGGTILRSYGHNGRQAMPWEYMHPLVDKYVKNLRNIWGVQNAIMHEMKQTTIGGHDIVNEVIGDLYTGALKFAYFKGDIVPFNTYELSEFVKSSIRTSKIEETLATVWDLYNWGTEIMKPGIVDIGEIANNSNVWADYLLQRFAIQTPTLDI